MRYVSRPFDMVAFTHSAVLLVLLLHPRVADGLSNGQESSSFQVLAIGYPEDVDKFRVIESDATWPKHPPLHFVEYRQFTQAASEFISNRTSWLISTVSCADATLISHIARMCNSTHIHLATIKCTTQLAQTLRIPHHFYILSNIIDRIGKTEDMVAPFVIYDDGLENVASQFLKKRQTPAMSLSSFYAVTPTLMHTMYSLQRINRVILITSSNVSDVLVKAREHGMLGIHTGWLILSIDCLLSELQTQIHDGDNILIINVTSQRFAVGYFSLCAPETFNLHNMNAEGKMTSWIDCALKVINKTLIYNSSSRHQNDIDAIKDDVVKATKFDVYGTNVALAGKVRKMGEWTHNGMTGLQSKLFQDFNGFNGRKLKVTTLPYYPLEYKQNVNGKMRWTGICIDMLDELALSLNFTYTFVRTRDGKWGTRDNGTWNGMIGKVARKEVFMAIGGITISSERAEAVDFMTPFMESPAAMIMSKPNQGEKAKTYLLPFKGAVWVTIAFSVVFAGFVVCFFEMFGRAVQQNMVVFTRRNLIECVRRSMIFVYGSILQQGGTLNAVTSSSRIFTSLWWWFAMIVIATYTGNLIAFLTVSKTELQINTLEELVSQTEYAYGTVRGTVIEDLMMSAENGVYQRVGDAWRRNPSYLTADNEEKKHRILNEKYVHFGDKVALELLTAENCDLVLLKEDFFNSYLSFAMQKSSPYLAVFNEQLQKILESGLLQIWKQKHWPKGLKCVGLRAVTAAKPANVADTQGAFYVLSVGLILAAIILGSEILRTRFNRHLNVR